MMVNAICLIDTMCRPSDAFSTAFHEALLDKHHKPSQCDQRNTARLLLFGDSAVKHATLECPMGHITIRGRLHFAWRTAN